MFSALQKIEAKILIYGNLSGFFWAGVVYLYCSSYIDILCKICSLSILSFYFFKEKSTVEDIHKEVICVLSRKWFPSVPRTLSILIFISSSHFCHSIDGRLFLFLSRLGVSCCWIFMCISVFYTRENSWSVYFLPKRRKEPGPWRLWESSNGAIWSVKILATCSSRTAAR